MAKSFAMFLMLTVLIVQATASWGHPLLKYTYGCPSNGKPELAGLVKHLQDLLRKCGFAISVDGCFGSATLGAVKSFQGAKKLSVDGDVGDNTWRELHSSCA